MKRETWEETGIEVGEVVYHSSQPWPGGYIANFVSALCISSLALY